MRRSEILDGIIVGLLAINTILLFLIYTGLRNSPIMSSTSELRVMQTTSNLNGDFPRVKNAVTPEYPEEARKNGWEGTVIINTLVGTDGLVKKALVLKSSGYPILDSAAIKAVRKYIFEPGKDSTGKTVPKWVKIPVIFKLRKGAS